MLAAASTSNGLYLIDFEREWVGKLPLRYDGALYGFSWFQGAGDLTICFLPVIPPVSGDEDLLWYAGSEVGFVANDRWCSRRQLSHAHQILCTSDRRVVCSNTGRNCLTVLDPESPYLSVEWHSSDRRWDRESSADNRGEHLNSVFERDGALWVMAHRFDRGSRVTRLAYPSLRIVESFDVPWCTGMHNLWTEGDGTLLALDSFGGAIVEARSGDVWLQLPMDGLLRGVASTQTHLLVGSSPLGARSGRQAGDPRILAFDRIRGMLTMEVMLEGAGCVRDIRILDEPDLAHHGVPLAEPDRLRTAATEVSARFVRVYDKGARSYRPTDSWIRCVGGPRPEFASNGSLRSTEQVCRAIFPTPSTGSVGFRYKFEQGTTGHASLAIDVGPMFLADRDAHLLLLNFDGKFAFASIWSHATDCLDWRYDAELELEPQPATGTVSAHVGTNGEWRLRINGLEIKHPLLASAAGRRLWGCRWLNALVFPLAGSGT